MIWRGLIVNTVYVLGLYIPMPRSADDMRITIPSNFAIQCQIVTTRDTPPIPFSHQYHSRL